jgi:hypothetical protein
VSCRISELGSDRGEVAVTRSAACTELTALDQLLVPAPVLDRARRRVIIFDPCRSQYGDEVATRAIVPSSFMISQTTPAGSSPASRARSTAASVCPARSRTPPGFASQREHVAGLHESLRPRLGIDRTWIVAARSAAEIPVVTPSARLDRDGERRLERRARSGDHQPQSRAVAARPVIGRQISPRACVAMKLIASGS